jgi:hypothetical protein
MVVGVRQAIRESIRVDRCRYEISAVPVDENDYLGEWRCPHCGRGEQSAIRHPRSASALEWARNCVSVHHAVTHGNYES